ncbi:hypothetical protein [Cyanobium sp. ATX 6F1]|uniref:hypothetical protein n=1 Tax=unclassified Cyanobium TaxID=2627006 RepID=UPI0020CF6ECA|nr:hypothetical protein [Cyanobium sp. ATX 6F1]MCP9915873.1 hypothetical protein [Cyanobium sp. ATX 6F1]
MSVLILQGTDDPLVPFGGGNIAARSALNRGRIISTDAVIHQWLKRNGSQLQPVIKDLPDTDKHDGCRVQSFSYAVGKAGTEVVLYRMNGGGHTWPGAPAILPRWLVGNTCHDISGTQVIWDFFKAHPKP